MALPNVPKTNWESDDGVTFTDMNEIGENIQDLEDDKYESGDSPTFDIETVTTSNSTTVNSTTINNSGFITSNYKSSDGSEGINSSFTIGLFDYVFKDGLLVSRTAGE